VKNLLTVLAIILVGIVASCASQSNHPPSSPASDDNVLPQTRGLPAECQSRAPERQNLTDGAQTTFVVKCTCTDRERAAVWYNAVRPNVDPADYCAPSQPVFYEPVGPVETVGSTASDASPPVANPLPPMPTVLPVQLPARDAGVKPASSTTVQVTLMYRDVKYICKDGVAIRDYKAVNQSGGQETVREAHQQCVGQGFACLTDVAEQRDPSRPPCNCTGNRRPMLLSATHNTWACYDQTTPTPRASASAGVGSPRP